MAKRITPLCSNTQSNLHLKNFEQDSKSRPTGRCGFDAGASLAAFPRWSVGTLKTEFQAELTLTNQDSMRFRMLLGRTAMNQRFIIDPSASYVQGKLIVKP